MVTIIATAAACVLALLGELLHARRCRRLSHLAFGPRRRPAHWARTTPLLRVAGLGLLTWGLTTLMQLEPRVHRGDVLSEDEYRHLVLVLDVSPSMRLRDAGPTAEQSRMERAHDVLDSLFQRVSIGQYLVSVVATYNGAKPVVIDTKDSEVVRNILGDLPMEYAFKAGRTRLFDGLEEAVRIAKPWRKNSTLMVLLSDGDTVPATGMPELPPSVSGVLVVGVGDPLSGKFIDGRQSRQDSSTLRQIATRLGGVYHDANRRHLPTGTIRAVTQGGEKSLVERLTLREYALMACAAGAALLALVPLLLHLIGTGWRPGVVHPADAGRNARDRAVPILRGEAAVR